jgi:hypothetical protein
LALLISVNFGSSAMISLKLMFYFSLPVNVSVPVPTLIRAPPVPPKLLPSSTVPPTSVLRLTAFPHNYLNFWFTGGKKMDFSALPGTALLNVKTRQRSILIQD